MVWPMPGMGRSEKSMTTNLSSKFEVTTRPNGDSAVSTIDNFWEGGRRTTWGWLVSFGDAGFDLVLAAGVLPGVARGLEAQPAVEPTTNRHAVSVVTALRNGSFKAMIAGEAYGADGVWGTTKTEPR